MTKEWAIKLACSFYNYRWPEQLTSGVMFYDGYTISIVEFNDWAKNFK